jgi:3-phosphoshikimate 1-carboxyvinyltransferase
VIVRGVVRPPGDKSITHRALLLAGLVRGASVLRGALTALDVRSTARVLRQLGADVTPLRPGPAVQVRGRTWRAPSGPLHCGNSGTTARLLLGLLAGHRFEARVTGDASLRRRPMRRVTEPLTRMGAHVLEERGDGLPIRIRGGRLVPLDWTLPVASAQLKSALLLAGLAAGVRVTVREPAKSRDHTERLLRGLGAPLHEDGLSVTLEPTPDWLRRLPGLDITIPADPSSAAFLVAAALLAEGGDLRVRDVGVNPTRIGFLKVLARMGAAVRIEGARVESGEPVADLRVSPADLSGVDVPGAEIPSLVDEVPVLAVLASRAAGESVFRSVGELRVKESDRLALLAANLRAVGAGAEVQGDDLHVRGTAAPPAGSVDTAGDHRLAMAFAVLGTLPGARVRLSERASAAVSYPGFFDDLARIGGRRTR